jgi:peptide deformylase
MSEIVDQHNPILAKKAVEVPVEEITSPKIKTIIARMKKALTAEELGVAIAAPQIGESIRIFVVSGKALAKREGDPIKKIPDRVFINPEIIKTSRKRQDLHEGCLSVQSKKPETFVWGMVPRAEKIKIRAYDELGKIAEHNASGFLSQIFQHEIDHLEGILYTSKAKSVYEEKLTPSPK